MNLNTKKDGTTIKMKKRGNEVVAVQAPVAETSRATSSTC